MVIRVAPAPIALALALAPLPVAAQSLDYNLNGLVFPATRAAPTPQPLLPEPVRTPPPSATLAYRPGDLLYDRTPDHIALAYDLRGLTGIPLQPERRDHGPLEYRLDGLVRADNPEAARAD